VWLWAGPTVVAVRWGLTGQKSAEVVVPVRGTDNQPGRTERRVERKISGCSCWSL
jgi:hypothetical protein